MNRKDLILLGAGYAAGRLIKNRPGGLIGATGSNCSNCTEAGRALANCRYKKKPKKRSGKIGVSKVVIKWSEMGGVPDNKTFTSIDQANQFLKRAFQREYGSRGEKFDGGYDKTKFMIYFEDGEEYEGRLDISLREDNPLKANLIQNHIKSFLNYYLTKDPTRTQKDREEIKQFLNTYKL